MNLKYLYMCVRVCECVIDRPKLYGGIFHYITLPEHQFCERMFMRKPRSLVSEEIGRLKRIYTVNVI